MPAFKCRPRKLIILLLKWDIDKKKPCINKTLLVLIYGYV
jgi:hypothetical protein